MKEQYLATFWYWITERESIRMKRESGQLAPWTEDKIMKHYHFCNVRREDDRVTKEIREVVRKHKVDYWDLPWVYTAARMFNKASTLDALLNGKEEGWEAVKSLRDKKKPIFHVAYVVSTCGKKVDKVDYVRSVVEDVKSRTVPTDSLRRAYETLRMVDGLGSFLAGQVVADLKNDRYLTSAYDWEEWSSPGPGSLKGLSILCDKSVTAGMYDTYITQLYGLMPTEIRKMGIHAQDLQNCLCEFSKYIRLLENRKGRRRPYYVPYRMQGRQ